MFCAVIPPVWKLPISCCNISLLSCYFLSNTELKVVFFPANSDRLILCFGQWGFPGHMYPENPFRGQRSSLRSFFLLNFDFLEQPQDVHDLNFLQLLKVLLTFTAEVWLNIVRRPCCNSCRVMAPYKLLWSLLLIIAWPFGAENVPCRIFLVFVVLN